MQRQSICDLNRDDQCRHWPFLGEMETYFLEGVLKREWCVGVALVCWGSTGVLGVAVVCLSSTGVLG